MCHTEVMNTETKVGAVVLETVAGVPGMVAGMWNHLRSLRKMKPDDRGWIKTL